MARKLTLHKKKDASGRKRAFPVLDIVILAGGLGTRLRPAVSGRPKVLAEIGGRPFIDILIENLLRVGMQRIIISVGYLKDHIKDYYAEQGILFAEEESALGTGGGLKNAVSLIRSDQCLVMNGDSWVAGGIDF